MPLRVAAYGEYRYRQDREGLSSDQSFALFLARLGDFVDRLLLVGRLEEATEPTHHRLRGNFEFCGLPDHPGLGHLAQALRATLASVSKLWRSLDEVDVVWLLGPNPLGLVYALLAKLRRRRVVLGVRQDIVALTRSRYGRGAHLAAAVALERSWRLLAHSRTVVTVGADLEAQYRRARRVVPISVSLVDEADLADPAVAAERDYGGELVALSVGRLEPQKNPLLLADVLAELRRRDPRWRLVVCGSGTMEAALAERVRELGLAEHTELRGYVPVETGLAELYRSSHAFLHVSWTEGFPQVLVEAFAAGLPTVATAVGGIDGWARDAALLVAPGDARAAADALQQLAADPQLRARLIGNGIELARRNTIAAQCRLVAAALQSD